MVNGISPALSLCPQAAFEVHLNSNFYVAFMTLWAHFIARLQAAESGNLFRYAILFITKCTAHKDVQNAILKSKSVHTSTISFRA